MNAQFNHVPVLFDEALKALNISASGIYVDGTFGRGGHSGAILQQLGSAGRLLAIDKDTQAVAYAQDTFGKDERFSIRHGSFAMLGQLAQQSGVAGKVDGLLLDLGVSSPQLDDPARGFSFLRDGPLDMRMDVTSGVSAAEWLASADGKEIAQVLKEFGDERFSKRIAKAIIDARQEEPITTTGRLAAIIEQACPTQEREKHPATRSFQAIRIYINKELEDLKRCLEQSLDVLAPLGRLVVVSFHSLEDRMVKRFIRDCERGDDFPADLPVTQEQLQPKMRALGKAIYPSADEIKSNPRARSAVLRVAERLA